MPEYDQMVDKYLAMGYSINNAVETYNDAVRRAQQEWERMY